MKNVINSMIEKGAKEAQIKKGKIKFFVNGKFESIEDCNEIPAGRFYSLSGREINREEWKELRKDGAVSVNENYTGEYTVTIRGMFN